MKFSEDLKYAIKTLCTVESNNLKKRYMLLFFLIVFIPILIIFIISMVQYITLQDNQTRNLVSKQINATESIVSNHLSSAEKYAYFLLSDSDINRFVSSNDITKPESSVVRTGIHLNNALKLNESVSAASVYSFKNNYLFGTRASGYIEDIKKQYIPWYDYYKKTGETNFIISAPNPVYSKTNEICMVRSLHLNGNVYAFVILNINPDVLFSNQKNCTLVYNPSSTVLYSNNSAYEGKKINEIDNMLSGFYKSNNSITSTREHIYSKSDLSYGNMTIMMTEKNTNGTRLYIYIAISFVFMILTLIITLWLSKYLTDVFYSHISKTISYLTDESDSTYDNSIDELSWIKNNIYEILNSNKELELELSKNIVRLKNSSLSAMQMQCNPHFLFNSLNVANMHIMSKLGGDNSASEIISLVSDLLRTALDTEHYFVTVEEELSFAKKYIQIEAIKHDYNFDVIYDVDDSVLLCKTVKLTMQPIIENAFKYGIYLLPKHTKGVLKISIKDFSDKIIFKISDNGDTNSDTIESVSKSLDSDIYTIAKKNIGLKNVNSRIKILFGPKYGCKIYRENNKTFVEMIIPKTFDNTGGNI